MRSSIVRQVSDSMGVFSGQAGIFSSMFSDAAPSLSMSTADVESSSMAGGLKYNGLAANVPLIAGTSICSVYELNPYFRSNSTPGAARLAAGLTSSDVSDFEPIGLVKPSPNANGDANPVVMKDDRPSCVFRSTSVFGSEELSVIRRVRNVCETFPLNDRLVDAIVKLVAYYHSGAFEQRASKQYVFFGDVTYSKVTFHDQLLRLINRNRGCCRFFSPDWKTAELMKTIGGVLAHCKETKKDYFGALWSSQFNSYHADVLHAKDFWDKEKDCYKSEDGQAPATVINAPFSDTEPNTADCHVIDMALESTQHLLV